LAPWRGRPSNALRGSAAALAHVDALEHQIARYRNAGGSGPIVVRVKGDQSDAATPRASPT
jgi:hypothetical protein